MSSGFRDAQPLAVQIVAAATAVPGALMLAAAIIAYQLSPIVGLWLGGSGLLLLGFGFGLGIPQTRVPPLEARAPTDLLTEFRLDPEHYAHLFAPPKWSAWTFFAVFALNAPIAVLDIASQGWGNILTNLRLFLSIAMLAFGVVAFYQRPLFGWFARHQPPERRPLVRLRLAREGFDWQIHKSGYHAWFHGDWDDYMLTETPNAYVLEPREKKLRYRPFAIPKDSLPPLVHPASFMPFPRRV